MMRTKLFNLSLSNSLKEAKNTVRNNFRETFSWFYAVFIRQEKAAVILAFRFIRWRYKELLLCFLLAFLFAKVDKIQHFFRSFAIDIKEQEYSFFPFLGAFVSNGIVVLWLCYVFWHKPKNVKGRINKIFGNRRDMSYEIHYNLPNGLWWVAVVSTLPMLLVNVALCISLLRDYNYDVNKAGIAPTAMSEFMITHTVLVYVVATLLFLFFSALFRPRLRENISLKRLIHLFGQRLALFSLSVFISIAFFYYYGILGELLFFRLIILGGFIFIPSILLTHVWFTASKCLWKENKTAKESAKTNGKQASRKLDSYFDNFRYTSYFVSICIFIMLNHKYFTNTELFSIVAGPVPVLLFVFIFYYQFWDFILHNVTRMRRNLALVILLLLLWSGVKTEQYNLKYNGKEPSSSLNRADLDQFFLQWAKSRFLEDPVNTQPVCYLVAAEGGGSRAGAWTAAVLTELDQQTAGAFKRNCFAISSVSGGSVGSAVTLALWDNALRTKMDIDSLYRCTSQTDTTRCGRADADYIRSIFKRNYISTAIVGIFFYDFWQSVPGIHLLYSNNYSRTDRHQDEENDAVGKALKRAIGGKSSDFKTYYKNTSFLRLHYAQAERDVIPIPSIELPLLFPNTTRVEDGRRGVISPIEMGADNSNHYPGNPFTAAVDVIGIAAKENRNRSFSLSEAAGLSQLFPYVNSNVKVSDLTGRYMDGGVYENMGLTTLSEIRRALLTICYQPKTNVLDGLGLKDSVETAAFRAYLGRVSFKFIMIYNIFNHGGEDLSQDRTSIQLIDPISALLRTPFSGHTDHIYHRVKKEMGQGNVIEFPLLNKDSTTLYNQDIIMSRWLSKYEMDFILSRSEMQVKNARSKLNF